MDWTGERIREEFLHFFQEKGHQVLPSSSLLPHNDPTVLLTTAGMLQFKPILFGRETPTYRRVTTCQKCFRTTDLDNVGRTARHHTFFEMLGNFSFGDYYKAEAIAWGWEFLTKRVGLPADKLSVSVFHSDDEAYRLWQEKVGLPPERIARLGEDSNFWAAGDTGPCGPCSEIYMDLGPERGCGQDTCGPGCDCERFLEVWNLVFMEFSRREDGSLEPLPARNIDTGMGLERLASVLQGKPNNFETDLLFPIIEAAATIAGKRYGANAKDDVSFKVIADHMRAMVHLVDDGVLPSNEGRGYVLRRIMRRVIRHGRLLGIKQHFLPSLAGTAIQLGMGAYPELQQHSTRILEVIRGEENQFFKTLDRGMKLLEEALAEVQGEIFPGEVAFELHDTYGFPYDLTVELVAERGLKVDEEKFKACMREQQERARAAHQAKYGGVALPPDLLESLQPTQFLGYTALRSEGKVLAIIADGEPVDRVPAGIQAQVILDRTPFYAESGGQVGDTGLFEGAGPVLDCQKAGDVQFHVLKVQHELQVGDTVTAAVDPEWRERTRRHHTATHLLHAALRRVLGEHVTQQGSLVAPNHLRFDFSHPRQLTRDELLIIERLINDQIFAQLPVLTEETSFDEARQQGALAFFGDKYGDRVRVVRIDGFSHELCGGTHCRNVAEVSLVKIVKEEAIAAGKRRVEALAGRPLYELLSRRLQLLDELVATYRTPPEELLARIQQQLAEVERKEKELRRLQEKLILAQLDALLARRQEVGDIPVVAATVDAGTSEVLRHASEKVLAKLGSGVVALGTVLTKDSSQEAALVVAVSDDLTRRGIQAGPLVKELAARMGGKGGGRPQFAQAGGGDPGRLGEALEALPALLSKHE